MKRVFHIIVFIVLSASAFAQVRTDVQVGYGIMPASACKGSFRQIVTAEAALSREDADKPHFVEYTIDLGLNLGTPPADFNGIPSQVRSDRAGEILLGVRYLWMNKGVALYSGVSLGAELRWQSGGRGNLFTPGLAYNVTALGVRTEYRRVIFSGELGVGHLGLLRLGVGYRF